MKKQDKIFWTAIVAATVFLIILHIQTASKRAEAEVALRTEKNEVYYHLPTSPPPPSVPTAKPLKARQLSCMEKKVKEVKFKPVRECKWTSKQQKEVWEICKRESFSFETAISQAKSESSWNIKAIGDGGRAWGAWQIHPAVWGEVIAKLGYQQEDMFNLKKASHVYIYIMKAHLKKWDNIEYALLAWRWGGKDALKMVEGRYNLGYATEIISQSQKYERRQKQ